MKYRRFRGGRSSFMRATLSAASSLFILIAAYCPVSSAQVSPASSNPPATGQQESPVPRYVGANAGQWERWDLNAHLNGHAPITPLLDPGTTSIGGLSSTGRLSTLCIPNPAAPTVVQFGATGSTTLSYFLVCHDSNSGVTLPSSATTIINGNAALSSTNFVSISWSAVAGCSSWDVLKGNTSTALATGITGLSLNDTGQATSAYVAPTRNSTCDIGSSPLVGASPAIQGFSVNGMNNLGAQAGARPSVNTTTANTTAGSTIAVVSALSDFTVGDTVDIRHGGVASTLAAPTALTVTPFNLRREPFCDEQRMYSGPLQFRM